MNILQRFQEYAEAFEKTYVDDDWTRLEPYFAEGATYEVRGLPAFPIHAEGRDQVFAAIKGALDGFDRRCDSRDLSLLEPPTVEGNKVTIYWQGVYTLGGAPDLRFDGYEDAYYNEEGRIIQLVDRYDEKAAATISEWLSRLQKG